jgi:hypothetical protein
MFDSCADCSWFRLHRSTDCQGRIWILCRAGLAEDTPKARTRGLRLLCRTPEGSREGRRWQAVSEGHRAGDIGCLLDRIRKHGVADKLYQIARGVLPSSFDANSSNANEIQIAGLDAMELEKVNAWRALRQASWAGAFYLSTTDILVSRCVVH